MPIWRAIRAAPSNNPVIIPQVIYDQWFVVNINGDVNTQQAPMTVTMQRAATINGATELMPPNLPNAKIQIRFDAWKQLTPNIPEPTDPAAKIVGPNEVPPSVAVAFTAAMQAMMNAMQLYAAAHGLL